MIRSLELGRRGDFDRRYVGGVSHRKLQPKTRYVRGENPGSPLPTSAAGANVGGHTRLSYM